MIGLLVSQIGLMEKEKGEGVDLERYVKAVKIRCDGWNRGRHAYSFDEIHEMIKWSKEIKALYQDGDRIYVRRKGPDSEDYPHIKEMIDRKND